MSLLKDLLVRIFVNFRTSLEGLAFALIASLSASGVELSEANKGKLTGYAVLLAIAVWKIFSRDPVPEGGGANTPLSNDTLKKYLSVFPLAACLVFQSSCAQKTTLDRIGAVVVLAVAGARSGVDQLCASGNLDSDKCVRAKAKLDLARVRADGFAGRLSAFGAITPGNISALTLEVSEMTTFLQQVLADLGLDQKSVVMRVLSYAVDALIVASAVIAAIHPPAVVSAQKNRGIARPNPLPSQVHVAIPKPDSDVQRALDGAGRRALGPSRYRELKAEFGLQTTE